MTKVAIIGNAGGGKSLLARDLSIAHGIPSFSIDNIQWGPGWTRRPLEVVARTHVEWMAHDRWIVDGWGSWDLIETRLASSDTIVVVDFPFSVQVEWVHRRQAAVAAGLRTDWPPPGCDADGIIDELLRVMHYVDDEVLPRLRELITRPDLVHKSHHLRSPAQLNDWRAAMCDS